MNYKTNYKKGQNKYTPRTQRGTLSESFFQNKICGCVVDENEQWLNVHEAAQYLRISPNALRILVHRARIRSFKLGRRLRFLQRDICAILQLKEV